MFFLGVFGSQSDSSCGIFQGTSKKHIDPFMRPAHMRLDSRGFTWLGVLFG